MHRRHQDVMSKVVELFLFLLQFSLQVITLDLFGLNFDLVFLEFLRLVGSTTSYHSCQYLLTTLLQLFDLVVCAIEHFFQLSDHEHHVCPLLLNKALACCELLFRFRTHFVGILTRLAGLRSLNFLYGFLSCLSLENEFLVMLLEMIHLQCTLDEILCNRRHVTLSH